MAKELSLGTLFYGKIDASLERSIRRLERLLNKLNRGFATFEKGTKASAKASRAAGKAADVQRKQVKKSADEMGIYGRQIGKVTGGIQRLTAAMKVTAAYGLAATAIFGVINAAREGVGAIFDFDQALKNLQAITDATDAEIAVLGDRIREVAATTKYSAREVSDAAILVGQAGFDAAESLDAIQAVAMLATGTLTDMATTADLLTTAIRAFGLEASESGRVADIFATAVNKSKLTIDKLRTAFNYLGPVAHKAGLSLEETAAGAMVLGTAGLRGSTIGTGFRQVLARLIAPSEKLRLAFRAAGADIERLNPLTNDFADVLDELSKVITDSGVAIRLFGMRASAAAVALAEGRDVYKEMLDYTYRVGVATKMANKQMEGLAVMAKNLRDKLHELAIALGEGGIASAFRVALQILRPLVALMSEAATTTIGKFIVAVTSLTVVVTALGLAFRYLAIQFSAIAFGYTVAVVKTMAAAQGASLLLVSYTALGVAVKKLWVLLLAHPFVAVTAAVAAVVVGFKTWQDSIKQQTMELHKQSIEIAASVKSLSGYQEKLENVEEGSREHRAIIERLIEQYPHLRSEVDILTTSLQDQIDAVEELTQVELERYLQNQARILAGMSKELDGVTDKLDKWGKSLREKKYDIFYSAKYVEELKERQKELGEELKDQVPLWAGALKQMENIRGIDFSSTIQNIENFIRSMGVAFSAEEIKLWAEQIKAYLDKATDSIRGAGTSIAKEMKVFSIEWAEHFETLLGTNIVHAQKLLKLFDKTVKEVEKLGKEMLAAGADSEKVKEAQEKIKRIRLKKFIETLDKEKKVYQDFFDKIEQLHFKALGEMEQSEEKAAENRHTKRMAAFKKAFESEKDYDDQIAKYKIKSEKLRDAEAKAIRAKYFKERLDQEIKFQQEIAERSLKMAKIEVDRLVSEELISKKEGNILKLELEKAHWVDILALWDIGLDLLEKKYGEDTEAYKKALEEKKKILAELFDIDIKMDTEGFKKDLSEAEKTYEIFLERVQGAFADTFYDIFKMQWEGWGDLVGKMRDLFFRTLAEMAAKAAVTRLFPAEGKLALTGAKAGGLYGAIIGATILGGLIESWESARQEKRQKRETWGAITAEIDEMLERFDDIRKVFNDINKQFDEYRKTLLDLQFSSEELAEVERKRWEVLEKVRKELEEKFMAPLKDMIAGLTLPELEFEFYKLDAWFESQLDTAKALGYESVKLLREAYELSKKQLLLREREMLLGAQAGFEQIIKQAGMTPLQIKLESIMEMGGDYPEAEAAIQALWDTIASLRDEIVALTDESNAVQAAFEAAREAFRAYKRDVWSGRYDDPEYQRLLGIMETLRHEAWDTSQANLAQIDVINNAIADLISEVTDLEGELADTIALAEEAVAVLLEALAEEVQAGWDEIIRKFTLTEYEQALHDLDEWYEEQLSIIGTLGLSIDDLNYAYELQLQALNELDDALGKTIESIDEMIESLTVGAMAPVQSAEYYMTKYAGLLETAMTGAPGAVDELLAFIPTYLDFMKGYGLDYAGLTASIVAALEDLKITLPGLQAGGLTSGLTFAGELGPGKPEWVVPTYEPQRSRFLDDVGMDPDKIGEAIARHLVPALGDKEINLTLEIDGQPVRATVTRGLRFDTDLIEAVRRAK